MLGQAFSAAVVVISLPDVGVGVGVDDDEPPLVDVTAMLQYGPVKPVPSHTHTGAPPTLLQRPDPHCTDAHAVTCSTVNVSVVTSSTPAGVDAVDNKPSIAV